VEYIIKCAKVKSEIRDRVTCGGQSKQSPLEEPDYLFLREKLLWKNQ